MTPSRTALGISTILLTAVLAACADSNANQPSTTAEQPNTSPSANATTSASTGSSATTGNPAHGGDVATAQTAVTTAEKQGGRAIELDHDDSGEWKIDVVQGDRSTETHIAANGSAVIRTDGPEALDQKDTVRIQQTQVTLTDALNTATHQVPGTLDEAGLTTHKGKTAYSVEIFTDDTGAKKNAYVDAVDGTFLEATNG